MDNIQFDIQTICTYTKLSCEQLAIKCGIEPNHLKAVMAGRARLLAHDIKMLHKFTGIPYENIKTD